jgi:DNA-binding NarL/FixJ family response regulator
VEKIKVLLVDDQRLMIDGLKTILELENDIEVIGAAYDGKQAYEMVAALRPEIVLMDIRMPVMDGVESTRLIKQDYPETVVLVLTTFDDDAYLIDALNNGASGYLLKDIPADRLLASVRNTVNGNFTLPASIVAKLTSRLAQNRVDNAEFERKSIAKKNIELIEELTLREEEIAMLLVKGLTNREIANNLFLTEGTVKNYISTIYSKIGTRSRAEAVLFLNDFFFFRDINGTR